MKQLYFNEWANCLLILDWDKPNTESWRLSLSSQFINREWERIGTAPINFGFDKISILIDEWEY